MLVFIVSLIFGFGVWLVCCISVFLLDCVIDCWLGSLCYFWIVVA